MSALGVIGECMLEFRQDSNAYLLGYGGDVFNTAVYASRLGLEVSFFTALGDDTYSDYLVNAWENEHVGTETVRIVAGQTPSLYIIQNDETGERTFSYWRDASPFRKWLEPGKYVDDLPDQLEACQCIYFSGITLALLSTEDRVRLLEFLISYREKGGLVGFDPNYRPRLWSAEADAVTWIDHAYAISDFAFPSYDDEVLLRGTRPHGAMIDHISHLGAVEILLKDGAHGVMLSVGGEQQLIKANDVKEIVDTTAAGDSFNGGYLAKRLEGDTATASAEMGCKTAAQVIQCRGAIIPLADFRIDPRS